jgi:hypothetical protein
MYSQILKEILLDIESDENAKEDLIHFWYEKYHDKKAQLKGIGEFESKYRPRMRRTKNFLESQLDSIVPG